MFPLSAGSACAAVLALVTLLGGRARADCDAPFDDPRAVLDFHLSVRREDWRSLLASAITSPDGQPTDSPACRESFPKFPARFRCGDGAFRDVTVRKKKREERARGRRRYIPWDLDLAFGQQAGSCQPTPLQCPATVPLLAYCDAPGGSPASPYGRTTSRLGLSLACHPAIQPRYLALMCALTQGPLAAAHVLDVWHETCATLADVVPREAATVWRGIDPLAAPTRPEVIETFGSEYARLSAWNAHRARAGRAHAPRRHLPERARRAAHVVIDR